MRVTGVRITVFCSAIVIDVIVHCHTAGALLSQTAENNCPYHRVVGFLILSGQFIITHASMPVISLWRHLRKHRQVHDDRGNRHVLSLHRLHRHLSALEDAKNTVVEVRTQRLNVSLVWIADSSPPGARERQKTQPCVLMLQLTRGAVPRLWCDTLAKRA